MAYKVTNVYNDERKFLNHILKVGESVVVTKKPDESYQKMTDMFKIKEIEDKKVEDKKVEPEVKEIEEKPIIK